MFKPLAYTKTFAMAASSLLAVTIIPVLMTFFITERPIDPNISKKRKRRIWAAAAVGPVLLVAAAGIAGADLPDWSLMAAIGISVFAIICLVPQRLVPEARNPLNRLLVKLYRPIITKVVNWRKLTILIAVAVLAATWYPARQLGSEFMPPLNEGDLLYMPTTLPGISVTKARELLQQTDKIIKRFPEVKSVHGKIGRAETATDPAPLTMIETTIMLRPTVEYEKVRVERFFSDWPGWLKAPLTLIFPEVKDGKILHEWRKTEVDRFFSKWPGWLKAPLTWIWPEERYITMDELSDDLDAAIQFPGLTNAWTMPIKTRIDMLSTGIKTPVGIKLMGPDLERLSALGSRIEKVVRGIPGTLSAYSERTTGGNYLDFEIKRHEIARYGLTVADVQEVIMSGVGGMNITHTVEGLARYPVNLRYQRELRDDLEKLKRVLVATPTGAQVPLAQLAELSIRKGPPVIKSENARQTAWIFIDIKDVDVGTYVARAQEIVNTNIDLPSGYSMVWSGQFEYMQKARQTLNVIVPVTVLLIFVLLYVHFQSVIEAAVVMVSLPFSLAGGVWLLYLLGYNLSVAVVVGFIALAGLAAETGVVMLVYLDEACSRWAAEGRMKQAGDLHEAIIEGAVIRVRPVLMTVATTLIGLLPIMIGTETGAGMMKRIAAPMVGGLISATILTLIIIPAIYEIWKRRELGI